MNKVTVAYDYISYGLAYTAFYVDMVTRVVM